MSRIQDPDWPGHGLDGSEAPARAANATPIEARTLWRRGILRWTGRGTGKWRRGRREQAPSSPRAPPAWRRLYRRRETCGAIWPDRRWRCNLAARSGRVDRHPRSQFTSAASCCWRRALQAPLWPGERGRAPPPAPITRWTLVRTPSMLGRELDCHTGQSPRCADALRLQFHHILTIGFQLIFDRWRLQDVQPSHARATPF
jgi:hypothetical protein